LNYIHEHMCFLLII